MFKKNYKFSDRSLEGTFIRCWDQEQNRFVNRNLKDASDREFDDWVKRTLKADDLIFKTAVLNKWSISERTKLCRWLYEQGSLVVLVDYLEHVSTLELDIVTQNYLDTYNWYGTLMAIAYYLPEGTEKDKIEMAIAQIKPEPSIEEAIQEWGLDEVIKSMLYCAEVTGHKIKCPSEVKQILSKNV